VPASTSSRHLSIANVIYTRRRRRRRRRRRGGEREGVGLLGECIGTGGGGGGSGEFNGSSSME